MRKTRRSPTFMPAVYRAIMVIRSKHGMNTIQVGGGTIRVDGFRYNYRDLDGGVTIFGGRYGSKRPCFILTIEDTSAILQGIETGQDCSLDEGATAKHTVLAAARLANERGATTLIFTDNSTKNLGHGKSFHLSDMYFLTTGKTWYESILPCRLVSPQKAQKYELWKSRVTTNIWDDVYSCLKKEYPSLDITIDIDGSTPGSAMLVLRAMKAEKNDFFADYEAELLICSRVGSLHTFEWICDL
jgi:hypothetical protein